MSEYTVHEPDYPWLFSRTRAGRARGPQGTHDLLEALNRPDRQLQSIRVVGTNGKGSSCAMLEAGLLAAGQRVGRFTSPHLERFEERLRVMGREISPAQVAQFIEWAKRKVPGAAFFDLTLALACQYFAREEMGWAVMEAGVGGQSDATQALENVQAVCLTNVALDHTATLGGTLAEITADKAGAAAPGKPLLTTANGEAHDLALAIAQERGAPFYSPQTHPALFTLPHAPALPGAHQRENAALALATLRVLGFEVGLHAALAAHHPGRLEEFVIDGKKVIIDGAHNPHAAQALAQAVPLAEVLLFGSLSRKDSVQVLLPLLSVAPVRVFTVPAEPAHDPSALAQEYGGQAIADPRQAIQAALDLTPPGKTLLVAGSLYLAGLVRGWSPGKMKPPA